MEYIWDTIMCQENCGYGIS